MKVVHLYCNHSYEEDEVWCGDEEYYTNSDASDEPEKADCIECLKEMNTMGRRALARLSDLRGIQTDGRCWCYYHPTDCRCAEVTS